MTHIGKYLLRDGTTADRMPKPRQVLGVIFDETDTEYVFLPLADIDCHRSYELQEIIDIGEAYNLSHGNRYLHWKVPALKDWNMIVGRLGQTEVLWREELSMGDRMEEWTEFDADTATFHLRSYHLLPGKYYWSSSTQYADEVYLLDLEAGTIVAFPVWDDGEPYDYALRMIGHIKKVDW